MSVWLPSSWFTSKLTYGLDLCLRCKSMTVDLVRIKPSCRVKLLGRAVAEFRTREGRETFASLRRAARLPIVGGWDGVNAKEKGKTMRRLPWEPPVRPLPALLAAGAVASFGAALVPGSSTTRCVRRGIVLGGVAAYSWMTL